MFANEDRERDRVLVRRPLAAADERLDRAEDQSAQRRANFLQRRHLLLDHAAQAEAAKAVIIGGAGEGDRVVPAHFGAAHTEFRVSPSAIDLAEDRERWNELCVRLDIPQPPGGTAVTAEEASPGTLIKIDVVEPPYFAP